MARQLILQNLMKLAQGIGANPSKFMGTRGNITFLGRGPTSNPLFQGPLRGIESATEAQLGPRASVIEAVEDAMGFASANKLNSIQIRALELNLQGLNKIYNPPVLPSASVTPIAPGIEGLKRFPKETHKFMGRPLKDKDFAEIDRLVAEGKLPPAPQGWIGSSPSLTGSEIAQKTNSARATMYRLLDEPASAEGVGLTLREIMSKQDLKMLLEGGGGTKGEMIPMFAKYFGNAAAKNLPSEGTPAVIDAFAKRLIQAKDKMGRRIDDPFFRREDLDFAGGGLAEILQVPRRGRVVHPGGYAGDEETSFITDTDKPVLGWGLAEWVRQLILGRGNKTNQAWEEMNKAKGGRVGYSKGRAVKSLMGLVNKKFGKDTLKRASDLPKGTKYETLEAVKDFEARNKINYLGGSKADPFSKDFDMRAEMDLIARTPYTPAELKQLIIKKYKGKVDDRILQQMLTDDNPQRLAEVMATIDEALLMQAKGMNPESIIASFKESFKRKPSASGGLARILEV